MRDRTTRASGPRRRPSSRRWPRARGRSSRRARRRRRPRRRRRRHVVSSRTAMRGGGGGGGGDDGRRLDRLQLDLRLHLRLFLELDRHELAGLERHVASLDRLARRAHAEPVHARARMEACRRRHLGERVELHAPSVGRGDGDRAERRLELRDAILGEPRLLRDRDRRPRARDRTHRRRARASTRGPTRDPRCRARPSSFGTTPPPRSGARLPGSASAGTPAFPAGTAGAPRRRPRPASRPGRARRRARAMPAPRAEDEGERDGEPSLRACRFMERRIEPKGSR